MYYVSIYTPFHSLLLPTLLDLLFFFITMSRLLFSLFLSLIFLALAAAYEAPPPPLAPAKPYTPPAKSPVPPVKSYTPPPKAPEPPVKSYTPPPKAPVPPVKSYTPPPVAPVPPPKTPVPPVKSYTPPPPKAPAPPLKPYTPPVKAPAPPPSLAPYYGKGPLVKKQECVPLCNTRCGLHSRMEVCMRACSTCCYRCRCVPPGTYGNKEVCGRCYANMTTHGGRPKCP